MVIALSLYMHSLMPKERARIRRARVAMEQREGGPRLDYYAGLPPAWQGVDRLARSFWLLCLNGNTFALSLLTLSMARLNSSIPKGA